MNKICFKCGVLKQLSEYYKHKMMADGHLNKCIECAKKDVRKHRRDNPEKVREYDRDRSALPHRVALNVAITKRYRAANPLRVAANNAVARAVKSGRLVRLPCWTCGADDAEAHHFDYDTPLDVTWLCPVHHREIHLLHPEG